MGDVRSALPALEPEGDGWEDVNFVCQSCGHARGIFHSVGECIQGRRFREVCRLRFFNVRVCSRLCPERSAVAHRRRNVLPENRLGKSGLFSTFFHFAFPPAGREALIHIKYKS